MLTNDSLSSLMDFVSRNAKAFSNKNINVVLDETNLLLWKQQVILTVHSHRLERLMTGSKPALSPTCACVLVTFNDLSIASTSVYRCRDDINGLEYGDDWMRVYLTRVKKVCDTLASCGSVVSQAVHVVIILKGLSYEYQSFVVVITDMWESVTLDGICLVTIVHLINRLPTHVVFDKMQFPFAEKHGESSIGPAMCSPPGSLEIMNDVCKFRAGCHAVDFGRGTVTSSSDSHAILHDDGSGSGLPEATNSAQGVE
ncbi:hypothetical protein F3Y22_tig00111027pilonHSYRG00696 [Hibiscus syriacus]|uniref:Uncharacterized protein n=1 Tax=Hibiscus syriacus TaxID=106335 RepID=A0A6A2Z6D8_HIBSY|nr:hypothetical protein F3Y22_tig00111027pilonHSYRG00696 [Hibiscus syriacus]